MFITKQLIKPPNFNKKMAIIPGEQKLESSFVNPQRKKQKKMVYVFILVVVLIAAVLYFGFFRKATVPSENSTIGGAGGAATLSSVDQQVKLIEAVSQIKLDSSLLKDKKFEDLTLSGQFPLTIGEKGRANPFAGF